MKLRSTKFLAKEMAGARSLWRANGMRDEHFGRPIIAVVNSFSQFVPGHIHLQRVGAFIKGVIEKQGYFAPEFNTIAIDDGIAMGHEGMLYSLPSRDLIADSIEYVVNAHCADAMICITNCDKITPGMLMAAMRLNIPTVFVSGGPMEAGRFKNEKVDLVDVMIQASSGNLNDTEMLELEKNACPGCGSCSGMFTANSMNCLTEALGLALPGNGSILATHPLRNTLFERAALKIAENAKKYYSDNIDAVLPRMIATRAAFINAMKLDIAMGGSTNTVLHLLAIAHEGGVDFSMKDIDELSRTTPCICKIAPSSRYYMEDFSRAGGVSSALGMLADSDHINTNVMHIEGGTLASVISENDISKETATEYALSMALSAPGSSSTIPKWHQTADLDRQAGVIRDLSHAYSEDGGLAVLFGNIAKDGCIVKTAGVDASIHHFKGKAIVFESQQDACDSILSGIVKEGDVVVIRFEGPAGGPGMQEMLYPTSFLKSKNLDKKCALLTDGRFSGGTSGLSIGHISPEAASGGEIALVKNGDIIEIDILNRKINLMLSAHELEQRREEEGKRGEKAFRPRYRARKVSNALRIYASFVSSANKGAIRIL